MNAEGEGERRVERATAGAWPMHACVGGVDGWEEEWVVWND
jgi:hypothetical protein